MKDALRDKYTYTGSDKHQFSFYVYALTRENPNDPDDETIKPLSPNTELPLAFYVKRANDGTEVNRYWEDPLDMLRDMTKNPDLSEIGWQFMINSRTKENLTDLRKSVRGTGENSKGGKSKGGKGSKGGKRKGKSSGSSSASDLDVGQLIQECVIAMTEQSKAITDQSKSMAKLADAIAASIVAKDASDASAESSDQSTSSKDVKTKGKPGPKTSKSGSESKHAHSSPPQKQSNQSSKPKVQSTIDLSKAAKQPKKAHSKSSKQFHDHDRDQQSDSESSDDSDAEVNKRGEVVRYAKGSKSTMSDDDDDSSEEDSVDENEVDKNGNLKSLVASDEDIEEEKGSGDELGSDGSDEEDGDYSHHSSGDEDGDENMEDHEEEYDQQESRREESKKRKRAIRFEDEEGQEQERESSPAPKKAKPAPSNAVPVTAVKGNLPAPAKATNGSIKKQGLAPPTKGNGSKSAPSHAPQPGPVHPHVQEMRNAKMGPGMVGSKQPASAAQPPVYAAKTPSKPINVPAVPPCPEDNDPTSDMADFMNTFGP